LKYTKNLNILYVEDDNHLLEETSDILEDYFLKLDTAVNGQEAIEKYKIYFQEHNRYYDLILTDINMPIMSGDIFIDRVQELNSEQAIIVMSANNESDKLINLIQKNINSFILKPVKPTQLIDTLYKSCKSIVAHKNLLLHNNILGDVNNSLDLEIRNLTAEILAIKRLSVETIIDLIENYDDDTGSHVKRIESYSNILLENFPHKNDIYLNLLMETIPFASLLHDTGKFLIPKEILNKPTQLTDEEFKTMKTHSEIGGEILFKANETFKKEFKKDSYFKVASDIAFYHHEKWNGKGYPKGLSGTEIPFSARIVSIADVYDALRSKRVYKDSFSHEKSVQIIVSESGKAFDPQIIDVFKTHHIEFNNIFLANQEL